jgi:hypothetical protein
MKMIECLPSEQIHNYSNLQEEDYLDCIIIP